MSMNAYWSWLTVAVLLDVDDTVLVEHPFSSNVTVNANSPSEVVLGSNNVESSSDPVMDSHEMILVYPDGEISVP